MIIKLTDYNSKLAIYINMTFITTVRADAPGKTEVRCIGACYTVTETAESIVRIANETR